MIGALEAIPRICRPLPSWNTNVVAPNAAPIVSRKPTTAVIGTSSERKTSDRINKARPTTSTRNTGSADDNLLDVSMLIAVVPVTRTVTWYRVCARFAAALIWLTRFCVAVDDGPLFGVAVMIAMSPALLGTGGATVATSSACLRSWATRPGSRDHLDLGRLSASETIVSGPLNPGPKPFDNSWYALYWVELLGRVPASGRPSRMS